MSRSDTRTPGLAHGGNDDHPSRSIVAPRRDGFVAGVRGLKPTATVDDHSAVTGTHDDSRAQGRRIAEGEIFAQLERGLVDFLQREKLGRMTSVPHDATFSSLGIDSLGAAQLAIEIEKAFGVKITDETLYDYAEGAGGLH